VIFEFLSEEVINTNDEYWRRDRAYIFTVEMSKHRHLARATETRHPASFVSALTN